MSNELLKRSVRIPPELDQEIREWAAAHQALFPESGELLFSDVVRLGMSWFVRKVPPQTPIPGVDKP